MSEPGIADPERAELDLLLRGFQVSRMLRLIADFGLANRIPLEGSVRIDALAAGCGVQSQPLLRVFRALASCGVFGLMPDGSVAHTPRSRLLRTDIPGSLHHAARFWTAPGSWRAWERLDEALHGGVPHEVAWGMSRFEYLRAHPEEALIFDAMMANFPDDRHAAVAAAYDFSAARLIADIGGGNGTMLRRILARFAGPRGLVLDLPHVVGAIPPAELIGGRISVVEGSFFEGVPAGADIYMLVRVLHDWPDDDCRRILRACRAAMGRDALLLIGEQLLDPDTAHEPPARYLIDTHMMVIFGSARERSKEEFRGLLADAGLTLRRIIPTGSAVSIVEAAAA